MRWLLYVSFAAYEEIEKNVEIAHLYTVKSYDKIS